MIVLDDDIFSERFHREHLLASPLFDQEDFSEGAAANDRNDLEVGESDVRVVLRIDKGRTMCALWYLKGWIKASVGLIVSWLVINERLVEILSLVAVAIGWNLVLACLRLLL